jgi:uncharacterized protein (UPF0332 family)
MKKQDFLNKLKREKKLELVEPSEEIKQSYLKKAEDCLKSAKILFSNKLYENSTSEAYYCMYNSLLALFFKTGIKSENHSASLTIFEEIFGDKELTEIITFGKTERIDKQYYVEAEQVSKATEKSCNEMVLKAESFLVKMKLLISNLTNDKVTSARKQFNELFLQSM